jgi:regulator of RNase E activity RraA
MKFPTFCRGTNLINGFGSGWQIAGFQEDIIMPGHLGVPVTVRPGDWIIGDADGVVVVPRERIDEVTEFGMKRLRREEELKSMLDSGELSGSAIKETIFEW